MTDRAALEAEWLTLTRYTLPALARDRDWPVGTDHCFQRVLLDHAVGGCWYDHLADRPAYRRLDTARLAQAIALGRAAAAGEVDFYDFNRQSLIWRGKPQPRRKPRSTLPSVDR